MATGGAASAHVRRRELNRDLPLAERDRAAQLLWRRAGVGGVTHRATAPALSRCFDVNVVKIPIAVTEVSKARRLIGRDQLLIVTIKAQGIRSFFKLLVERSIVRAIEQLRE
jgi:hypothetical protein